MTRIVVSDELTVHEIIALRMAIIDRAEKIKWLYGADSPEFHHLSAMAEAIGESKILKDK